MEMMLLEVDLKTSDQYLDQHLDDKNMRSVLRWVMMALKMHNYCSINGRLFLRFPKTKTRLNWKI